MPERRLLAVTVYPLRSAPGVAVPRSALTATGLDGDRRWLLLGDDGRPVSLTDCPQLVRLRPAPLPGGGLQLADRDGDTGPAVPPPGNDAPALTMPRRDGGSVTVRAAAAADPWLAERLGRSVRLVHLPAGEPADRRPLLLLGTATLAWLAERLGRPVEPERFRANLLAATRAPWEEERWTAVRIGGVLCAVSKTCPRCPMVTVDPETGERDPDLLPQLARARGLPDGETPCLGVYLQPAAAGELAVGDPVVPAAGPA